MTNNLYKLFQCAILFTGLLLLPFSSFSQQEEPKRVTVVVTVKEIPQQKEIVQLPADNTPKKVSKATEKTVIATKKNSLPTKVTASKEITVAKAPIVAKKTSKSPSEKPKVTVSVTPKATPPTKEETKLAQNKPVIAEDKKSVEKVPTQKPVATLPKTAPTTVHTDISKSTEQVNNKTITTVKDKNESEEIENTSYTSTVNSFSYIWIGAFLIIAGVVLGLLFGKPAFLISFVGIVFIVLGLLI